MTDPAPYRRPYPNTQPEYLFPKYASTVKGEPSASSAAASRMPSKPPSRELPTLPVQVPAKTGPTATTPVILIPSRAGSMWSMSAARKWVSPALWVTTRSGILPVPPFALRSARTAEAISPDFFA